MKIKLVKVLNVSSVKVGEIVLVTPSNLDKGKKDIYATTMSNKPIGRLTTKEAKGFVSRDKLRSQLSIGEFITAEVVSKSDSSITLNILTKDSIGHINIDTYASNGIPQSQLDLITDKIVNGGLGSKCTNKATVVKEKGATPRKVVKEAVAKETAIINAKPTNTKGADTMKNTMMDTIFGGKFGAVKTDEFKLGANGKLAVKVSNGDYLSLDTTGEFPSLVNTSDFTFEFGKVFVLPTEATQVKKNDLVIKDNSLYFVVSTEKGRIQGISPEDKRIVDLVTTKHVMMKKEFVRVVKTMFDFLPKEEKKGNLMENPLMLMVAMNGEDNKSSIKDLLMMQMMSNGGDLASNPMLMMLMMKDGGSKDMMLPMLMNQGGDFASNPMLMMALMGDDKEMKDLLPMLLMTGGIGGKDGVKATGMEAMLPLLMMGDGDIDPMMLMLMTQGQGGETDMNSILPLMLLGNNKGGKKGGMDSLLPLMLMNQGGQGGDLMSNPLLLMTLMGDGNEGGIDPMMLLMMNGGLAPKQAEVIKEVKADVTPELVKEIEALKRETETLKKENEELRNTNKDN